MMNKGRRLSPKSKKVMAAVLMAAILLPFVILALFTFPRGDDFFNAEHYHALTEKYQTDAVALLADLVGEIVRVGYAPISLLTFLFSPIVYAGVHAMRITVFCMNLLFLLSVFLFFKWVFKGLFHDADPWHWSIASFLFAVCFVVFRFHAEPFAWFTCSFGYLLPVNCLLLGLACFIKAHVLGKKRYWVFSAFLGVIGALGPVLITVLVCGLYFVSLLLLLINAKSRRGAVIVTLVVVAVGLATLLMPGHYTRHDSLTTEYDWWLHLQGSAVGVWQETITLLQSPIAIVLCLFAILATRWFSFSKPVSWMNVGLAVTVALLGPVLVAFPYYFGYSLGIDAEYITGRYLFVLDVAILLGFIGAIWGIAAFFQSRREDVPTGKGNALALAVVLVLFCGSIATFYPVRNCLPLRMLDDFLDGDMQRSNAYWMEQLHRWEQSAGRDVLVVSESQMGYRVLYLMYPLVLEDPAHIENSTVARFFHLNSITAVPYQEYVKLRSGE